MRIRSVATALFAAWLAGCATGGGGSGGTAPAPAPETVPEVPRRTATMVVIRDGAGLERGDTVRVELARVSEAKRVPRLDGDGEAGQVPLEILGPTGVDTMAVTADRLNVYRCRSRGCTVLGYVARGQLVQVHDFVGGWFRFTGPEGTRGYIHSDGLELLLLYRLERLAGLRSHTRAYYRERLEALESDGGRPLFDGYRVDLEDGLLSFAFFTSDERAGSREAICNAMRGIARYVEGRMARIPPGVFEAYSAGIYTGSPGDRGVMIAGLGSGSSVYCEPAR